jgi:hypothetical protein
MTSAARRPRLNGPAARPASAKAESFWRSLRDDLLELLGEAATLSVGTSVIVPADVDELSADDASEQIDYMLDELRDLRAELASARRRARESARAGAAAATASATLVADRLYETPDGEIYRTYESGQGNIYVKIWTTDGWDYEGARGALRRIRPEHRMTVERAKELSLQWAQCIRCGAELSNAVSVERGIGPVCITKI